MVALGGVAALCEHAAVSEGELSDERRLLPTLLSIARGSLTQRGSPPMRRDALRALGALCGQRPLQRALIEGEGLPHATSRSARRRRKGSRRGGLLALLRLLRVPHARARHRPSPARASRALRSAATSDAPWVRCAAVALAFLAADSESTLDAGQPPRDSWASLAEAEERAAAAAAARSAVAMQALAASRAAAAAAADGGAEKEYGRGKAAARSRARSGSWWARRSS